MYYTKNLALYIQIVVHEEQNINIDNFSGTWSAFEKLNTENATYYIYESDTQIYKFNIVLEWAEDTIINIYKTKKDLINCLIEENIIDI